MAVPAVSSVRRVRGDLGDRRALKMVLSFVRDASTISPVIDAGTPIPVAAPWTDGRQRGPGGPRP
ncbi:hypothetical protein GCM10027072_56830 [Streptomyces bullii]